MKRGNPLNILLISSILLVLLMPLVSAGFFSDVNSWLKDVFGSDGNTLTEEGDTRSISGFAHLTDSGKDDAWCQGADINKDGKVDSKDQNILGIYWQRENCVKTNDDSSWCNGADIDKDGKVDSADLNILSINWRRTDCVGTSAICTDTDQGVDYFNKGELYKGGEIIFEETIQGDSYLNPDDGILVLSQTKAEIRLLSGKWIKVELNGVYNFEIGEGKVTEINFISFNNRQNNIKIAYIRLEDICTDSNFLKEYYCDNPPIYYDNYYCPNGCENGACVMIELFECNDRIDNDADGLIDYPDDPGCNSSNDNSELEIEPGLFNVIISLATLKDVYKIGEKIELTDPPDEIENLNTINTKVTSGRVIDDTTPNREITTGSYLTNDYLDIIDSNYQNEDIYNPQEGILERNFNQQFPESDGYIIQFEDEPIIKRKNKLDKKAEKSEGFIEEYPIISTITLYRFLATTTDKVSRKVAEYSENLRKDNENVKDRILNEINGEREERTKITAYAISEPEEVEIINEFNLVFNGIVLDINEEEAEEIKKIKGVKNVYPNLEVQATLMDSVPLINADDVWQLDEDGNNCISSGKDCLTGEGITIGIIDTGIDYTHGDLGCINDERCGNIVLPYRLYHPRIYENKIVWIDKRSGSFEIYMYDISTGKETLITDESSDFSGTCNQPFTYPDIYKNKIVYDDCDPNKISQNLFMYDISTGKETLITDKAHTLGYSRIDGNKIVWKDYRFGNTNIYMYDISTGKEIQITSGSDYPSYPNIHEDKVVWYDYKNDISSIYMYDISTGETKRITDDSDRPDIADIYGDKIVWDDFRDEIYMYDLVTEKKTIINNNHYSLNEVEIFGDRIVWREHRWQGLDPENPSDDGFQWDVYMYDISTGQETRITSDNFKQFYPHIYQDKIVYTGRLGDSSINWEIYMYDLSTREETQITSPHITKDFDDLFPNSKVIGGYDFVNNDDNPVDDHGHGTHVAATAAGNGILKGVAPDAKLYAYKVLNSGGGGWDDDIISAIERSIDPNQDGDFSDSLDIISLSLGGPGDPDDPISQAIDNAVESGVIAVIAAGNCGPEGDTFSCPKLGDETIGSPGTARKAITVGASDKNDLIAGFSSRGPVRWFDEEGNTQLIVKPDIVAPGVDICAAQWNGAWDDRKCFDDNHVAISGTSMATPIVSGSIALLKQKNPDWTPEEIKMSLRNTAVDIGENINIQGHGKINILDSINQGKPLIAEIQPNKQIDDKLIDIEGSAFGEGFESYSLYYSLGDGPEEWIKIITSNNPVENDILYSNFDANLLFDGLNYLKLTVRKNNGEFSEDYGVLYKPIPDSSIRITTDPSSQWHPKIYNDKIVWEDKRNGNWDIYMYDLSTGEETQITTNNDFQRFPAIYGDKIVLSDYQNGNWDIYMYDLSTGEETQITTNSGDQGHPDIYGDKIVWEDYRNGNFDIYMYDILTGQETQITTNDDFQLFPAIHGDKIFWGDFRNGKGDIYMYDLSTKKETRITTNPSDRRYPAIYENRIVWEDKRNGNWDIYMYDLITEKETQITTNSDIQRFPAIYGDKIVWDDYRNGKADIYMYDLSTGEETQITTNSADQRHPNIYGDKIVWEDKRNGNWDIYMYELPLSCTPKCTGKECGNDGCGGSCGSCSGSATCSENGMCIEKPRPQSKIVNNANSNITATLKIYLQRKSGSSWRNYGTNPVVDEEITIPANGLVKLDTGQDNLGNQLFAGWNNLDVSVSDDQEYRIYAIFQYQGGLNSRAAEWEFKVIP